MVWLNYLQLETNYQDKEFIKKFSDLFILRSFLSHCVFSPNFTVPKEIDSIITLTPEGEQWLPLCKKIKPYNDSDINFALFINFYGHELLIDIYKTDYEALVNIITVNVINEKIKFPWVYEKVLYDRFFDLFQVQTKKLVYDETSKLLDGTPQGVFQLFDIVVGPFGILNSSCKRFLPPVTNARLWHCLNPSCQAEHIVDLSKGNCDITEISDFISRGISIQGPRSEWTSYYTHQLSGPVYYNDFDLNDLPILLADAFSENELHLILKAIIDNYSKDLWDMVPKDKMFKTKLTGSSNQITNKLRKNECFQLILLMPNEVIITCIESLIDNKLLNIPPTEVRKGKYHFAQITALDLICECSQSGVRCIPNSDIPIDCLRLKSLIKELYKGKDLDELKFKLRYVNGVTIDEKIINYIHNEDPKRIINTLIISNEKMLRRTFIYLKFGRYLIPENIDEEDRLVDKILWKLGFNIRQYPLTQNIFWERFNKFLDSTKTYSPYDERDKELIRSAAVNFFVSLEEILDQSLSFITWVLLSDHYDKTKFKYNLVEARKFMASHLNGIQLGTDEPLVFDISGKNTLYPLIKGFSALALVCNKSYRKRNMFKRREDDLPHFHGKSVLVEFPFFYSELILDLREEERKWIISYLIEISNTFESAGIHSIRNRIEHKRDNFPTKEEIEHACNVIQKIVNEMEVYGIYPMFYNYVGEETDQYWRSCAKYNDYKGRIVKINGPFNHNVLDLPSLKEAQIIIPRLHVGNSYDLLRFRMKEDSDYTKLWAGYPKRKLRYSKTVPSEETVQ